MKSLLAGLFAATFLIPSAVMAMSPEGQWEVETREQRYNVEICGDGQQLCGTLVWLGNGGDKPHYRKYMNRMIIDHAPLIAANTWKGWFDFLGYPVEGTITQLSEDVLEIDGCVAYVLCTKYKFYRMK